MPMTATAQRLLVMPRVVKRAVVLLVDPSLCVLTVWLPSTCAWASSVSLAGQSLGLPSQRWFDVIALPIFDCDSDCIGPSSATPGGLLC